jgi:hypothetical protein
MVPSRYLCKPPAGAKRFRPAGTRGMQGRPKPPRLSAMNFLPAKACLPFLFVCSAFDFQTLLEPEALPVTGDDVGFVGQTIQQRCREGGLPKDLGPVGKAQIGSDNDRSPLSSQFSDSIIRRDWPGGQFGDCAHRVHFW